MTTYEQTTNLIIGDTNTMTDQYYRVDLLGSISGQTTMSTLYYKSEFEVTADLFPHAGAEGLAVNVKQEVWDGAMKECVSIHYLLEKIQVTPYNGAFELIYTQPYTLAVNEAGSRTGDILGPGSCVNIHFNLAAVNAAQRLVTPTRGYIAVPGVSEDVQSGGMLQPSFWNDPVKDYGKLAKRLSENIQELTPPAIWKPVRLKQAKGIANVLQKWVGAAEIIDAYVDQQLGYRRSRQRPR